MGSSGMVIVPSMQNDPNNPTCVPVDCPAGEATCTAAYNAPDDTRTMVCDQDSDLVPRRFIQAQCLRRGRTHPLSCPRPSFRLNAATMISSYDKHEAQA